MGTEGCRQA